MNAATKRFLSCLPGLLLLVWASSAHGEMVTGTYPGNGSSQSITGLPFTPAVVIVKGNTNKFGVIRTSQMAGDNTKVLVGATALLPDLITSLTASGFTVGGDDMVNKAGVSFYWAAFKEQAGVLNTGTYTGDGSGDQVIGGVGFNPDFIIAMSSINREAVHRTGASNLSFNFSNGNGLANVLTTPTTADGFRVGSDNRANESGILYYYVCWNQVAGSQLFGSYVGNGTDLHDIPVSGLRPDYVMVRDVSSGQSMVHHPDSLGRSVDSSLYFSATANASNLIQELQGEGFQVGSNNTVNRGGDFYAYMAWGVPSYSISGTVFEDLVGDVLNDGVVGDASNPGRGAVDVYLYTDTDGDGVPDPGEPLTTGVTNPVSTNASGAYSFSGVPAGDYFVVVDSRSVDPSQPFVASPVHWAEQTYGPKDALCADWVSGTVKRASAGPCYGGRQGAIFDDWSSGVDASEHIVALTGLAANVSGVDFGFSFNVVTNLGGGRSGLYSAYTGQGTIDMALRNADAIQQPNTVRFVPAVASNMTGAVFGGQWWRIDMDSFSAVFLIDDPNTVVDGTAFDYADGATVLDTNPGFMGTNAAGGTMVGLDLALLPQVERPELEIRGSLTIWFNGNSSTIQDLAMTASISHISVYGAEGARIRRNVLGSEPDDFVPPPATKTNSIHVRSGGFDGFIEDNLLGFNANCITLGISTQAATGWQITGNEMQGCTDGVEMWQLSPSNTVQDNLIGGNWRGVYDRAGSQTVLNNTISNSSSHGVILAGSSTTITRNRIEGVANGVTAIGDETPSYPNSPARLNRVTDNRFGGNTGISIDLAASGTGINGDGVTPNGGGPDATHGHNELDHPIITSALLVGPNATIAGTACANCTVEIYRAVADGDASDTYLGTDYGEGIERVAVTTADGVGDFSIVGVTGLSSGDQVSAIALTTAAGPADTSEFGPNFELIHLIAGTVFEDVNYGGGNGRDYATAKAAAAAFAVERPGVRVELYDSGGVFLSDTVTDANGEYGFSGLIDGDYAVRVVNETVTSSRPGASGSEWPVQTFRTDASGAVTPVAGEVGGADPIVEDDPPNLVSANLSTLTAQSLTPVTISTGIPKQGLDFGFNFDTIVNRNDTGQGSLRRFLLNSNTLENAGLAQAGLPVGLETSIFMVPAADLDANGVASIQPVAILPPFNDPTGGTRLDGATQTSNIGNTNGGGAEVELDGTLSLTDALTVNSANNAIRGLIINGFNSGASAAIEINGASAVGNSVLGCYIGTNFDASAAAPNNQGVYVVGGATANTIGGSAAGEGNVVSGNDSFGVLISGAGTDSNTVIGNLVGTDGNGSIGLGNLHGVTIRNGPTLNSIGGALMDEGNLISGNDSYGVYIFGSGSDSNTVEGNRIGTAADGQSDLGGAANNSRGVYLSGSAQSNTIGGTAAGEANVIAYNNGPGVDVAGASTDGNVISGNSIFENSARGIDLNGDGANDDKPVPVVNSIVSSAPNAIADISVAAGDIVELFRVNNPAAPVVGQDATGAGEGYLYLGTCVDNGVCSGPHVSPVADADPSAGTVEVTVLGSGFGLGDHLSATATDPSSGTSEFSVNAGFALNIVKRAFQLDGTTIASGSTLPRGMPVRFLLYVHNPSALITDVSLRDVLDPVFLYTPGSTRFDNSASCAATICNAAEEAAILAAVDAGTAGTDLTDGDVVSFGGIALDIGDQNAANAQLDIAAGKVWAVTFVVTMQ